MLVFIHERSSIRDIPSWGLVLMLVAAFVGALIAGAIHLQDEDDEESEDNRG